MAACWSMSCWGGLGLLLTLQRQWTGGSKQLCMRSLGHRWQTAWPSKAIVWKAGFKEFRTFTCFHFATKVIMFLVALLRPGRCVCHCHTCTLARLSPGHRRVQGQSVPVPAHLVALPPVSVLNCGLTRPPSTIYTGQDRTPPAGAGLRGDIVVCLG